MFARHVSRELARYCDGQLTADRIIRVEAHLASCERCRSACDEIRFAARLIRQLPVIGAPPSVWSGIAAQLDAPARPRRWLVARHPAFAAAIALLAVVGAASWFASRQAAGPWEVAHAGQAVARLTEGEWVETGPGSRARITVGTIGTVDVEPGTRVRLGALTAGEHRILLAGGTISAQISAPPRLFVVDTPASTVVDLGCAYTVTVNAAGTGELRVTEGWASLEWQGRASLVPAGAHGLIRAGVGPGTPYFEDASPALRDALEAFDFAAGGSAAITTVLAEARVRDTLTLWHLLSRVDTAERPRIYERIAALAPPPDTVSREQVLALDPGMLRHWREELAWTW